MGPVVRQLPANASAPVVRKFDPNASPILNVAFTGAPLDQLYDVANNQIQPDAAVGARRRPGQHLGRPAARDPGPGRLRQAGGVRRHDGQQVIDGADQRQRRRPVGLGAGRHRRSSTSCRRACSAASRTSRTSSSAIRRPAARSPSATWPPSSQTYKHAVQPAAPERPGRRRPEHHAQLRRQHRAGGRRACEAELKHLEPLLPSGTSTIIVNDPSVFTRASLDSIQHDLALAVLLVAAVMLVFLHDWRHTVIVLCAIPTSLISTFLVMYVLGFTLNTMSLMALALMIGILVDDSIVVLENIHRHLQLGESPWQAALNGRSEIGMAAIAITMADVVVYTPIAFMSGSIGQLFRQYGLTVVAATLFSLLMSFTLTPMLASRWLRHGGGPTRFQRLARAWAIGGIAASSKLGDFFARSVPDHGAACAGWCCSSPAAGRRRRR